MQDEQYDKLLIKCWNAAVGAYGTYQVYKRRVLKLNRVLNAVKVTGFILPILTGGIASTYYDNLAIMKIVIYVTSLIALVQLVLSGYLTALGEETNLTKYVSLSTKNMLISADFKRLAEFPPSTLEELKAQYDVLEERERSLIESDIEVTGDEERMGMRYGLREFGRPCSGCGQIPLSMTPSNCEVCGNFKAI